MAKKRVRVSFTAKLLLVYVGSLALVISLITSNQINATVSMLERENVQNLEMLTGQVALNFSDHQTAASYAIYSRLAALGIPDLVSDYNQNPGSNPVSLRYALAQVCNESTEYDYVMLETADGTRLHTSKYEGNSFAQVQSNCAALLEENDRVTYGSSTWYRMADEDVYILRDIYTTTPLRWVGRIAVHMKGELFRISSSYSSTGFLFFDQTGNYLTSAGMPLPQPVLEDISAGSASKLLSQPGHWADQDYYAVSRQSGGWITVGVSSTEVYRQTQASIVRNGVRLGVAAVALGSALMLLLIHSMTRTLKAMKKAMGRVAEGDFTQTVAVTGSDDISQLALTMNEMTNRIAGLLDELVEKERLKKDAELQILEYKYRSLETQIRPHFIYNALETVNAMAKLKGDTEIMEVVQRISRYFRNITVNTTRQFITAQKEFEILQDYTEIYRFIHGEKLKTVFSARTQARNAMIPTMILQPVVENALQHGVREQDAESPIIVHAYVTGQRLNLTVKDSGCGLPPQLEQQLKTGGAPSASHSGIGIGNVRQRLALIYGSEASFTIGNRPEGGVAVRISIPLSYYEPDLADGEDWLLEDE